jgi:hypothetical protein
MVNVFSCSSPLLYYVLCTCLVGLSCAVRWISVGLGGREGDSRRSINRGWLEGMYPQSLLIRQSRSKRPFDNVVVFAAAAHSASPPSWGENESPFAGGFSRDWRIGRNFPTDLFLVFGCFNGGTLLSRSCVSWVIQTFEKGGKPWKKQRNRKIHRSQISAITAQFIRVDQVWHIQFHWIFKSLFLLFFYLFFIPLLFLNFARKKKLKELREKCNPLFDHELMEIHDRVRLWITHESKLLMSPIKVSLFFSSL